MNVLSGFALYLLGAFALILLSIFNILPVNYLGGFVIAGFIGGLFFPWLNAWRQGEEMLQIENQSIEGRKNAASLPQEVEKYYPCDREPIVVAETVKPQEG